MNLFRSRTRRNPQERRPAPASAARNGARLSDPVAQAMSAGDRRSADVMWFGGMTFRMDGETR